MILNLLLAEKAGMHKIWIIKVTACVKFPLGVGEVLSILDIPQLVPLEIQ